MPKGDPVITIAELEKAINAVRMGQTPEVDLPPEVVRAISAAMEQLGDFIPTPEFLEKLQKSLMARMLEKKAKRRFGLKTAATAMGSVVMVAGIWFAFGDRLFLPGSTEPMPMPTAVSDQKLNKPQSLTASPQAAADSETKSDKKDAKADNDKKSGLITPPADVIMVTEANYQKIKNDIAPVRAIAYPGLYWLVLSADEAAKVPPAMIAQRFQKPFELFAKPGYEDPLDGLPEVEKDLQAQLKPGQKSLFLLQLFGKTQSEWRDQITATGAEIIDGADNYKRLILWATPEELEKTKQLEFVRWAGMLHPKYKLQEKLLDAADESGQLNIVAFAEQAGNVKALEEVIAELGGQTRKIEPLDSERKKVMIVCELPLKKAVDLAREATVISVYQKDAKSDTSAKKAPVVTPLPAAEPVSEEADEATADPSPVASADFEPIEASASPDATASPEATADQDLDRNSESFSG
jgi:hypothetical protein